MHNPAGLTPLARPCYRRMFALWFAARSASGKPDCALFPPVRGHFIATENSNMSAIKFRGVDFLQYDALLTEEERLVRDTTRQFIEDNLIPIIEECNRAGRFPKELVKPMADLGFFGASLKGYGCAGMGNVEYGLMTQELERGDSGVRSFVSVQSGSVHVSDLRIWQRRAERNLAAADAERREARLLRFD